MIDKTAIVVFFARLPTEITFEIIMITLEKKRGKVVPLAVLFVSEDTIHLQRKYTWVSDINQRAVVISNTLFVWSQGE